MTLAAPVALIAAWLLLGATSGAAELRDLGSYGATCPAPPPSAPRWGAPRVHIEPARALVTAPAQPPMPVATERRTYVLPVGWPVGVSSVVALVGRDATSAAVVRTLPVGALVLVVSSEGSIPLEALRQACPACRIGLSGAAVARRLGIHALPAVIRHVDGVPQVTEGPP